MLIRRYAVQEEARSSRFRRWTKWSGIVLGAVVVPIGLCSGCLWAFLLVMESADGRPVDLYPRTETPFALPANALDAGMLLDTLERVGAEVRGHEHSLHLTLIALSGSCDALPRIDQEVTLGWSSPAWRSLGGFDVRNEAWATISMPEQEMDLQVTRQTYVYNVPPLTPMPTASELATVLDAAAGEFGDTSCTIRLARSSPALNTGVDQRLWGVFIDKGIPPEWSYFIDPRTGAVIEQEPDDAGVN